MPTSDHRQPVRQWRITVTEGPDPAVYRAHLRWRTFPRRADQWDGAYHAAVFTLGPRIASPDDLEAVIALFVQADWDRDLRQSVSRRPKAVE